MTLSRDSGLNLSSEILPANVVVVLQIEYDYTHDIMWLNISPRSLGCGAGTFLG